MGFLLSNKAFAVVSSTYKAGKGPLKVSQYIAEVLEWYFSGGTVGKWAKKQKDPWIGEIIVISPDGRYQYHYTTPKRYQDSVATGNYVGIARKKCKKESGQECFLFASRNKIVWDNGSDKKKRRLKRKDIRAGKTLQILEELGFYDGGITQTKKIEKKTGDIFPTNAGKTIYKKKTMEDLVYLNNKKRNKDVKEHWNKKYPEYKGYKAWAESPNRAWSWRSSSTSEEDAITQAVDRCNEYESNYNDPPLCVVTKVGDKHLTYQEQADWMQKIYGRTTLAAKLIGKKKVKKKVEKKKQTDDNDDIVQQIKDLKELYDSGVLTKEEFEKAKKKLLN